MPTTQGTQASPQVDDAERARRRQIVDDYQDDHGWWHSIDVGHGVVTPGYKTAEHLRNEVRAMQFPDVRGKTVLDIGAWDGFYSFEAEQRGASRVVAMDHFVWSIELAEQYAYLERCRQKNVTPQPYETVPEIWRPDTLPGKRGFDTARELRESKVESVVADFMEADLDAIGSFDVVLFLGVLYHIKNPVLALERLRKLTKGVAVIETEAMEVAGCWDLEMWESYSRDQLLGDVTNWWAPNRTALIGMCKAAGFSNVRITNGLEELDAKVRGPQHYRLFAHAEV